MIKRTIEISREPLHLAVKLDQLQLWRPAPESGLVASIPCEDIGFVVVDNAGATYSHAALSRLIDFGAVVVFCNDKHLPSGLLLPLSDHTEVVWRLHEQIALSKPACKQLWRQTVRVGDQTGPLMMGLHRTMASLVRCIQGQEKRLSLPIYVEPTVACEPEETCT